MKLSKYGRTVIPALALFTIIGGQVSTEAQAQRRNSGDSVQGALDTKSFKKIEEVQQLIENNQSSRALQILQGMLSGGKLNAFTKATVYNNIASIHVEREDYNKAIAAYQNLLKEDNIPSGITNQTTFYLAQLYVQVERSKEAVSLMKRFLANAKDPNPEAYYILALAQYQTGDYTSAVTNVRKTIDGARKLGIDPQEKWLSLLAFSYFEKDDLKNFVKITEQLVVKWPKASYFSQLAGAYGQQGREKEQSLVLELAYDGGYLKNESGLLNLSALLMQNDVPYKAAKVLEKGMKDGQITKNTKNYQRLAEAWQVAQEPKKAIEAYKQAASSAQNGELDYKIGQAYVALDDWKSAETYFRRAIANKGGLGPKEKDGSVNNKVGNAHILLAQSLYYQDKFNESIQAFKNASKYKNVASSASQYVTYIQDQLEKTRQLREQEKALDEVLAQRTAAS